MSAGGGLSTKLAAGSTLPDVPIDRNTLHWART